MAATTPEQSGRVAAATAPGLANLNLLGIEMTDSTSTRNDDPMGDFADLEGRILQVSNWAKALQAIGLSPSLLDPGAVLVIGEALDELAGLMADDWQAGFRESNRLRDAARVHEAGR